MEEFIARQDTEFLFGTLVNSHSFSTEELKRIAGLLKPLGKNIDEFIYVADCKLITAENMKQLGDMLFISCFPATYTEHDRIICQAIEADHWEEIGVLAETPSPSIKRQRTSYKARESEVNIEGKNVSPRSAQNL